MLIAVCQAACEMLWIHHWRISCERILLPTDIATSGILGAMKWVNTQN
jgi:hypothetical protein